MKGNRKAKNNDDGTIMIIPIVGVVVIMVFAIFYVGTYITGTIGDSLVWAYDADNQESGEVNEDDEYRGLYNNRTDNMSLNCTIDKLNPTITRIYMRNNATTENSKDIWFNLSVNSHGCNYSSYLAMGTGTNWTLADLISAGKVSNNDRYLNVTWDVRNRTSWTRNYRIRIYIYGKYHQPDDWRTSMQNSSVQTLENMTDSYDSTVDVVVVAAIIVVLTIPLMAVVAIKKLL